MHAHITGTDRGIVGKFPLHGYIPLVRLRVAIVRVDPLVEAAAANLRSYGRRRRIWEPNLRSVWSNGVGVRVAMQARRRVAAIVER